jgi:hypothetical protein
MRAQDTKTQSTDRIGALYTVFGSAHRDKIDTALSKNQVLAHLNSSVEWFLCLSRIRMRDLYAVINTRYICKRHREKICDSRLQMTRVLRQRIEYVEFHTMYTLCIHFPPPGHFFFLFLSSRWWKMCPERTKNTIIHSLFSFTRFRMKKTESEWVLFLVVCD